MAVPNIEDVHMPRVVELGFTEEEAKTIFANTRSNHWFAESGSEVTQHLFCQPPKQPLYLHLSFFL